jgi:predicted MPP superfamily phosphohydrolase
MLLALKILAAIVFYGTAIEPRLVDRLDERGTIPNLPASWEHQQVAVFADLQVGMWWSNTDAARRLVDRIIEIHPAVVLLAGDYLYNSDEGNVQEQIATVLSIVKPLIDNHLPTYGVLGNHDYNLMNEHSQEENHFAHLIRVALDSAGVTMLDNRSVALVAPRTIDSTTIRADSVAGNVLYLVGVGDKWAKNDNVDRALANVPANAPRLIFMHDPDSFVKVPANQGPLVIAAHTHAMQIVVPWVSEWAWRHHFSDTGSGLEGWVSAPEGKPGNRIYVNRGVGFSYFPFRINAVPELTVFTLEKAAR